MTEKRSPMEGLHAKTETQRKDKDKKRDNIRSHLLYLQQRFSEEGQPNRIISLDDLAMALNITPKETKNMVRQAYSGSGLNEVLEAAKLPHKKTQDNY